jgi:hypothetical protein
MILWVTDVIKLDICESINLYNYENLNESKILQKI